MRLTKDDLQAIGAVVRPIVNAELQGAEKRLLSAMDKRFIMQGKQMAQGFADLKAVMENTYVSREEFEQVKAELQNEVDDLKKQVQALQKRLHTPS